MSNDTIRPIITAAEYAARHSVSLYTVQKWLQNGNIPGAYKSPDTERGVWLLPADTQRPAIQRGRPRRAT